MSHRWPTVRHLFLISIAAGIVLADVAQAVIPLPGRTLRAIAEVNRVSSRTKAIQLEMKVRIGEEPPIADAELVSHPSGLARLEIRGFDGRIDRYLLSGEGLSGTMNGRFLARPRPMLPPLFLLQPGSEATMRTALEAFDVRTGSIGLAPCGESDCFVIGDPRLEAPLVAPAAQDARLEDLGLDVDGSNSDLRRPGENSELIGRDMNQDFVDGRLPRFWVDTDELQVQRIDRSDGVFVIFGPVASFEKIKVPSWYEIYDPEEAFPMRFEIQRAVHVNAPPKAFDRSWLIPPGLGPDGE